MTKKKKVTIIISIVVLMILAILLFPIRRDYDDGGTVAYDAILYSVTKRHSLAYEDGKGGYMDGTEIRILSFEVYNDVEFNG